VSAGGNGERAAIGRIRRRLPRAPDGETWIGDDAAVVSTPGGERLLLAADAVVEGVHFDLDLVDPSDVGWKALAVNVSDIAAMGGIPLQALATVVGATAAVLDELVGGLAAAAEAYGCSIVGGDLSSGPCLMVSVAVTGATGDRAAVLRSNAQPGDVLFVTGALGSSAAGLRELQAPTEPPPPRGPRPGLVAAYRRPVARVNEGLAASVAGATAMIDVSDGLGVDLDHLATESRVGVVLDTVPIADGATLEEALAGGEDYELVFAATDAAAVFSAFEAASLRPPILIGACVSDPTVRRLGAGPLAVTGWEHRLE
jgi:thiamine-monophosphate kinase